MYRTGIFLIVLAVAGGCQSRLNFEQKTTLEPGQIRSIEIDGPRYGRPVTVEVEAPESEVDVYVCFDKDREAVQSAIEAGKSPSQIVGERRRKKTGPIEIEVPPRQKVWVFVTDAKKATPLTVKLVGR